MSHGRPFVAFGRGGPCLCQIEMAAVDADGALVERVAREQLVGEVERRARLDDAVLRGEDGATNAFEDALDAQVARAARREGRAAQVRFSRCEVARVELEQAEVADHDALASRHAEASKDDERAIVVLARDAAVARLEVVPREPHERERLGGHIAGAVR